MADRFKFATNKNSEYSTFLERPVLVSGAFLASHTGGCSIDGDRIELVVSTMQSNTSKEMVAHMWGVTWGKDASWGVVYSTTTIISNKYM